jgi:hypothetical protein
MADMQLERHDGPQPDPLVADCVDPQQIRSWLLDCEESHGARCNIAEHQSATLATELKFVDVIDQCIVSAPPNERYIALSYMWGGVHQLLMTTENGAELSLPSSLQRYWSNIPAVIQDAIHFVAALGERYLWVDSLCIVQNDVKIKHHQILQMGSIYNGALACLVGAVGSDAASGLVGVRPHTRAPEQKRPQYEDVYLINPGPDGYTSLRKPQDNSPFIKLEKRLKARQLDLNNRLLKSEYSSRGWTYQERILSRRCIYFMENMVYYHCRKVIRGENKATPYSQKVEDIRHLSLFMADPIFSGDPLQYFRTLGALYAGVVTEFTRKKLSFPLDILDAFSGISSAMENLCSWRLVAGMPENILEYALLWSSSQFVQRRCQKVGNLFPSWSWAGWHAEVDYDTIFTTERNFEPYLAKMESFIQELEIHDQQGTRSIQSLVPPNEKIAIDARRVRRTVIPDWCNRISESQMPNNVLLFQALAIPATDCMNISMETLDPVMNVARPSLAPIQRTIIRFRLSNGGSITGTLVSTGPMIYSTTQLQSCDLIFLSACLSGEDDSRTSFTNVMLVQWTGDFAERVAIGQVDGKVDTEKYAVRPRDSIYPYYIGNFPLHNCHWKTIRLI